MKESEILKQENNLLQQKVEQQLTDINNQIAEIIKIMKSNIGENND